MGIIGLMGILSVCVVAQAAIPFPRCLMICTADYRPVCGHNQKTYSNECELRTEACKKNQAIVIVYEGKCKEEPNDCSFPCSREYLPVCGSDGEKYSNECMMKLRACEKRKAITIVSRFAFEHTDCRSDSACNIPCTRDYRPVCGSDGRTHTNECEMRARSCKTRTAIISVHDGFCRDAYPEYLTMAITYALCFAVVAVAVKAEFCDNICKTDLLEIHEPVCGSDGKTYDDNCAFRKAVCMSKTPISIVNLGKCTEGKCTEKIKCTLVKNRLCASDGKLYFNECAMRRHACIDKQAKVGVVLAESCGSCPTCKDNGEKGPVCGSDRKTYDSLCKLRAAACLQKKAIIALKWGPCEGSKKKIEVYNEIEGFKDGSDYENDEEAEGEWLV